MIRDMFVMFSWSFTKHTHFWFGVSNRTMPETLMLDVKYSIAPVNHDFTKKMKKKILIKVNTIQVPLPLKWLERVGLWQWWRGRCMGRMLNGITGHHNRHVFHYGILENHPMCNGARNHARQKFQALENGKKNSCVIIFKIRLLEIRCLVEVFSRNFDV